MLCTSCGKINKVILPWLCSKCIAFWSGVANMGGAKGRISHHVTVVSTKPTRWVHPLISRNLPFSRWHLGGLQFKFQSADTVFQRWNWNNPSNASNQCSYCTLQVLISHLCRKSYSCNSRHLGLIKPKWDAAITVL